VNAGRREEDVSLLLLAELRVEIERELVVAVGDGLHVSGPLHRRRARVWPGKRLLSVTTSQPNQHTQNQQHHDAVHE